jgi:hypothetical protein
MRREAAELGPRVIAKEMVGRRPDSAQVDVVKPGAERSDALFEIVARNRAQARFYNVHPRIGSGWE